MSAQHIVIASTLLGVLALEVHAEPWRKHVVVSGTTSMINSAVAHDFDSNGSMDVLSSYDGRVVLLRGPHWEPQTIHQFDQTHSRNRPRAGCIHSCLMDVDGDGDLDFCGSNNTVFWLECPDDLAPSQPWTYRTIDDDILGTHCLITGDVNQDGQLDLIANSGRTEQQTEFPHSIAWLEIPEQPQTAEHWVRHVFADRDAPGGSHYTGLGDINGDGRPDICCAAKGGEGFPGGAWFAWWAQPQDPTTRWQKQILADNQPGASNIQPVDLDQDGHIDFVATRGHTQGVLWFRGPTFTPIEIDAEIEGPHCLATMDLDNDGDIDIATCGRNADGIAVWYENQGAGTFSRHVIGTQQGAYDVRATDMDGDGDPDLLIAGHASQNIVWYENPLGTKRMPALTVRGRDITTVDGEVVSMRGMNFGGWLLMETWIPSIEMEWHDHLPRLAQEVGIRQEWKQAEEAVGEFMPDEDADGNFTPMAYSHQTYIAKLHRELKTRVTEAQFSAYLKLFEQEPSVFAAKQMDQILRQRFGEAGRQSFWNTFHDTWITERDFQLARAHGFNFVRIPFWYRWFESDDQPYKISDYGFRYLDKALAWAEKHHLYVMLDFHGAVGGQSPWDHTGTLSEIEFFRNREYQRRTAHVWKAIANRYKHNSVVWAYDLLNEPFSASDPKNWSEAHDLLYDAIREVDQQTIIVMEDGYKLEFPKWTKTGFFPSPREMGWKNLVYSIHFYSGADPLFSDEKGLANHQKRSQEVLRLAQLEQNRHDVPIYFGEFSTMGDHPNDIEGMRTFLTMFNRYGFHWSPWTWKYVDDDNEGTIWGLYQYAKPWPRTPNLHRDSLRSLLQTISKYSMDDFVLVEPYANVLHECLSQKVQSANARSTNQLKTGP